MKGHKISANDLYDELKEKGGVSILTTMIDKYIADKEIKTTDEIKESANNQIDQLKAQYEQYGMNFEDTIKQSGYANEKDLLKDIIIDVKKGKMVDKYIEKDLTDAEINKYYENDIYGELTVRHILIKANVKDDASDEEVTKAENKAKKKAEELIEELDNGADFEKLAKENSDDEGTASEGGLLSDFAKEDVVSEFWDASLKLKDGEYSKEPVKSEYGYHVILRVSQKDKPKLKDVKDSVIEALVSQKKEKNTNIETETWAKIREDYKLKIKDSSLNKAYKKSIKVEDTTTNNNQ